MALFKSYIKLFPQVIIVNIKKMLPMMIMTMTTKIMIMTLIVINMSMTMRMDSMTVMM